MHDILHKIIILFKEGVNQLNEAIPVLRIGKYQPKYPLIQGGMGVDISGPNLAGHVAKCGAIGTIASVGLAHNSPLFVIEKHNYFDANEIVIKEAIAKRTS